MAVVVVMVVVVVVVVEEKDAAESDSGCDVVRRMIAMCEKHCVVGQGITKQAKAGQKRWEGESRCRARRDNASDDVFLTRLLLQKCCLGRATIRFASVPAWSISCPPRAYSTVASHSHSTAITAASCLIITSCRASCIMMKMMTTLQCNGSPSRDSVTCLKACHWTTPSIQWHPCQSGSSAMSCILL